MSKFHASHGKGVSLNETRTRAERIDEGGGILISESPLEIGDSYSYVLECTDASGSLAIGLTTRNGNGEKGRGWWSEEALENAEDLWIGPVKESVTRTGSNKLSVCVTANKELYVVVNNRPLGAILANVPLERDLTLVFELKGNAQAIAIEEQDSNVPIQILARGREACSAYQEALKDDGVNVNSGRIFVVGPERCGKSTLVSSLEGSPRHAELGRTMGIDIGQTIKCSRSGNWEILQRNGKGSLLDEDLKATLAEDIVKRLIENKNRKKRKTSPSSDEPPSRSKSGTIFSRVFSNKVKPTDKSMTPTIPSDIVPMVENLLQESTKIQDAEDHDEDVAEGENLFVSIWDFGGHPQLQSAQQLILAEEPIYILSFDLTLDLDEEYRYQTLGQSGKMQEIPSGETYLESIISWLNLIRQKCSSKSASEKVPNILIVGTHKDKLHDLDVMQESIANLKFERLIEAIRTNNLEETVSHPFYSLDASKSCSCDEVKKCSLCTIKRRLFQLLSEKASKSGQLKRIPKHWLDLKRVASDLSERGITFVYKSELAELLPSYKDDSDLDAMLQFYHSMGFILNWRHMTINYLSILAVQSTINLLSLVTSSFFLQCFGQQKRIQNAPNSALMPEESFEEICSSLQLTKTSSLILLNALNFVVEDSPRGRLFLPSLEPELEAPEPSESPGPSELVVAFEIERICPETLYYSCLLDILKKCSAGRFLPSYTYTHKRLTIKLEYNHQLVLIFEPLRARRIRAVISKEAESKSEEGNTIPNPQISQRLIRELEHSLAQTCAKWFPRLSFQTCLPCRCNQTCEEHKVENCEESNCQHFVSLNEVLTNKYISCKYHKVDTGQWRKFFPLDATGLGGTAQPSLTEVFENLYKQSLSRHNSPFRIVPGQLDQLKPALMYGGGGGGGLASPRALAARPRSPKWLKGAAKLLESGYEGEDWRTLAELLGYRPKKLEELEDTLQPSLTLFQDWLSSSGNTKLSIEMLCACLDDIKRHDVVEVIMEAEEEGNEASPQVFISYHWDDQEKVLLLRSRLDQAGITCWMDVGQMGGGDYLYNQIYKGINSCQVVLSCLSPRYAISDSCCKEMSVADLLHKPIVPIMVEKTPWPPPGPMALLLSQLIYIDLAGVGGHGGVGKTRDWNKKVSDLLNRLHSYITVMDSHNHKDIKVREAGQEVAEVGGAVVDDVELARRMGGDTEEEEEAGREEEEGERVQEAEDDEEDDEEVRGFCCSQRTCAVM